MIQALKKVVFVFCAADQPFVPVWQPIFTFLQVNPTFYIMKVHDIITSLTKLHFGASNIIWLILVLFSLIFLALTSKVFMGNMGKNTNANIMKYAPFINQYPYEH